MATADFSHAERRSGPAVAHGAVDAHAAPHGAHAHDAHAHGGHDAHGHGAHGHHDAAGDKKAAFVGLIGGMALIGALVYAMVLWTNAQFAGHAGGAEGGAKAAETTKH
jgi:hypothetical protein